MNKSTCTWVLFILIAVANWSCSSGSSDSNSQNDDPQGNGDPRPQNSGIPIAGFWDVSTTDSTGQTDVIYANVSPSGLVTEYDYDQDASGSGLNCYNIVESQITASGNNKYRQTDPIDGGFDEFTAIKNGNVLTVSYIDVEDDNNNGDKTDLIMDSHSAVVGISVVDLTRCDTSVSQGTGEPILGADGIIGHPTAELIGTWIYRSVTVDRENRELSSYLGFATGAIEARLHILSNSAYFYEEVDSRGGQLWAEWGFIFFNDGELDVNRQFDTDGPANQMTVFNYFLQNGSLILNRTVGGELVVFLLAQL